MVGYSAPKTNWRNVALALPDRGDNVLARLLAEPLLATGSIVFVVHSLGGLVVEQVLRSADRDASSDARAEAFLSRVRRIAFLGTPHRGAVLANLLFAARFLLFRPSAAARDLVLGNPQLRDLNRWYRKKSKECGIEHLVLAEARPVRFLGLNLPSAIGQIVCPDSADPGLSELAITVDESHTTICKPSSQDAYVYILVKDFIARPFEVAPGARLAVSLERNTSQLKQLTTQSQEQTLALQAFARVVSARPQLQTMDTGVIDAEVVRQMEQLRRSRFFVGVNTVEESRRIIASLEAGAFVLAGSAVKNDALVWCARFLATTLPGEAQSILQRINRPGDELCSVAQAFLMQGTGNLEEALGLLAAFQSPTARGAAYICVQKAKGFDEAQTWLQQSGLTSLDLDSDAKLFQLGSALDAGTWDIAYELACELTEKDFDRTPALLRLAADTYLVKAVPDELRTMSLQYIPSNAATFPLRGEIEHLRHRRMAEELYERLSIAAVKLGVNIAAGDASDRALWLKLRDPEHVAAARSDLATSLRDPAVLMRRLNLAVQFGIKIDVQQVDKEVDRLTALSGGASPDAAVARFALAFVQGSHAAAAAYIDKHREQLVRHLEWKSVCFFEIEALAVSGQVARASDLLQDAIRRGVTPHEEHRLRRLLDEAAGDDPIGSRLAIYEKTGSVVDLHLLVDAFEEAGDWAKVAEHGERLLVTTGDIADALQYVNALYNVGRLDDVLALFAEFPDLVIRYPRARHIHARTLFALGRIHEARTELQALRQSNDSESARQLQVSLAVACGDWESLQGFVEAEWSERAMRTPKELLRTGQIAQLIGAARGRELVCEAARRAPDDAVTLLGCYQAAVNAGWEKDEWAKTWLRLSAALSEQADDGLFHQYSLEELADRKPAWDKAEASAWDLLTKGEAPQFTLGRALNQSLLNLFLLPALCNVDEPDVRRRAIVHAFSGARASGALVPKVVAMDPTSIITMELLGLFGLCLEVFERVVIPHSTLSWLLEEQARILFHQPSRVVVARNLLQLVADQQLYVFDSRARAADDLVNEVGDTLAELIAEVSDPRHTDGRQRLIVRGAPIYRVSTFMKEPADLAKYMPYFCSAQDLIEKLTTKSVLTEAEAGRAREWLAFREVPWPDSPCIKDGAVIFLDGLSVSYFESLEILHKLPRAGVTVFVPQSEIEEARSLIRYDQRSSEAIEVVNGLRSKLKVGLESGKVQLGRAVHEEDGDRLRGAMAHPSVALLSLIDEADAAVCDDRYLNQHQSISSERSLKPMLTSMDLLDSLKRLNVLSAAGVIKARTELRRANYALIPVDQEELSQLISNATVENGVLIETAELRAIRESVLRVRMSEMLQYPKELPWLNSVLGVVLRVLKEQWSGTTAESLACARSDWLLKLGDMRGWAHRLNEGPAQLEDRYLNWVSLLMMVAVAQRETVREAHWRWFESRILNPMAEESRQTYANLLERAKAIVAQSVDSSVREEDAVNEE
ncbi:HTH domain-containing protein [Kinneretia aquatilis]|uniref:HTH domain-containing protein n=1 Tax=Kinneretia aquatilis TaxID=2070761 RepID=UPI00149535C4|nr:hypothetical protein [Paucibacter aquatile]WIV98446.1 hypothetical protein K9V56_002735 [Paucibacter aquatile]